MAGSPASSSGDAYRGSRSAASAAASCVGEAELPQDQHVRPEEPHAVGIVDDDVRGCQGKLEEAEVQGGLECLTDPRRELERPRGCERGRLPEEIRQRRALDDLGDQEELARRR